MAKRKLEAQEKEILQKNLDRVILFWGQIGDCNAEAFFYDWQGINNDLQKIATRMEAILIDEKSYQEFLNRKEFDRKLKSMI